MSDKLPSFVSGVFKMKCPHCGKGDIFVQKSVFPLSTCLKTVEDCSVCGEKITRRSGEAPGMNYAVTVVVYAICFTLYALIFGISFDDNSIYYAFFSSTLIILLLQPWLMRISKVLYLYIFTRIKFE